MANVKVPEKLHLIYPKSLAGRLEVSDSLRANVEVNTSKTFPSERLIDIEEVKELSLLTLRLEALCSTSVTIASPRKGHPVQPNALLGPTIREEMNDEELGVIIESLTTRIENSMSTLVRVLYESSLMSSISKISADSHPCLQR